MVQRRGPRLTAAQKTEQWRRWRRGESLNVIGRALGRIAKVVRYEVARTGGIPPAARQRSRLALTLSEREAISRGLASGTSVRQISRQLRRAPSTVESGGPPARRAAPVSRGHGGVAWRGTPRCVTRWPPSSRMRGRPSRSPAGSVRRILMIRPCTSRTKRSISACSSKAAACSKRRCRPSCASGTRFAVRVPRHGRRPRRRRPPILRGNVGRATLALRVPGAAHREGYADRRAGVLL